MEACTWPLGNGETLDFNVYDTNTTWNDVAGIYIFCGISQQNKWVPIYIGQTDSFCNRIPQHEQWTPASELGATHIHARGSFEGGQPGLN